MNHQSPGPLAVHGSTVDALHYLHGANRVCDLTKPSGFYRSPRETEANAALLAASFNSFDEAGRALGVDATELAKSLDLASVIRYALDYAQLNTTAHDLKNVGRIDQTDHARRTLAPLAELMQVKLPL